MSYLVDANLVINPIFPLRHVLPEILSDKEVKREDGTTFTPLRWQYKTADGGEVIVVSSNKLTPFDSMVYRTIITYRQEKGIKENHFEIPVNYIMQKTGLNFNKTVERERIENSLLKLMDTHILIEKYLKKTEKGNIREKTYFNLLSGFGYRQPETKKGRGHVKKIHVQLPQVLCDNLDNGYVARGEIETLKKVLKSPLETRIYDYLTARCAKGQEHIRNFTAFCREDVAMEKGEDGEKEVLKALDSMKKKGIIDYNIDGNNNLRIKLL
ncbi:hypothetical protein [Caldanaerobacter subterraneus]|uniref:Uncharacterized protein n=1 Tax=Caldanaerobacter subterraneus TaxID=911092 RepID=A0A4R2JET3_9THEO|nr:hypothetical protein [Caldanaerobacter subterraneus]TCO57494.1 hypothetical protein EV203_13116 [Caldanaerobacter subterraneus]